MSVDKRKKVRAIALAIRVGQKLQRQFPEIATLYRDGLRHADIVECLELDTAYARLSAVMTKAVGYALTGYDGPLSAPYTGLIPSSELEEICLRRKRRSGVSSSRLQAQSQTGLYAMSDEEKRRARSKGGSTTKKNCKGVFGLDDKKRSEISARTGRRLYEEGRGIHALSSEQRADAAKKSCRMQGMTPWSEEELRRAVELSMDPEYQYGARVSNKMIAKTLNEEFHEGLRVRRANMVFRRLRRYRTKNH
ncbi:hypothetical protein GF342_03255 [Candidatus Woesearchaeota archaeon]|nr:hypothetical protein [Candidatus Woesearchaeota archaeon]